MTSEDICNRCHGHSGLDHEKAIIKKHNLVICPSPPSPYASMPDLTVGSPQHAEPFPPHWCRYKVEFIMLKEQGQDYHARYAI